VTPPPHNHSWRALLSAPNESKLTRAWPRIVFATALSIGVTFIEHVLHLQTYSLTTAPFTILGVAISFFLGFRNTTAYNRFWEARTLWGRLINTSRSLTRQILTQTAPASLFVPRDATDRYGAQALQRRMDASAPTPEAEARDIRAWQEAMVHLIIGYGHAMRHHLRGSDPCSDLQAHLAAAEAERLCSRENVPLALLHRMGARLQEARQRGWLDTPDVRAIESSLTELTEAQGGCERIRNTPMPVTYTLLSHRIVTFFCCALPFGLIDSVKLLTPFVVFLVSYAFIGLDVLGEEISDPFGTDPHDLPLPALTATIEKNLRQMLNE
jgi:putative membrane protein